MPESIHSAQILVPEFVQTSSQCFYFVDGTKIEKLDIGDIFISFCNLGRDGKPIVAGARKYEGEVIDVPVMGKDRNISDSHGYCQQGDSVKIRIIKKRGRYIDLNNIFNIPSWYDNNIYLVNMDQYAYGDQDPLVETEDR